MNELMPCPFCGNAKNLAMVNEKHDHSGGYFIACPECGASTIMRYAMGDDPQPLLIEAWNRRAALRSMPQGEPVATIRYERGTPGKENDMPKVVSCNWLPDGVYSVYATPHTEAVRMSEADVMAAAKLAGFNLEPTANMLYTVRGNAAQIFNLVRAVEQATAARLGVKMGDV